MTQIDYIRKLYFDQGKTKTTIARMTNHDVKTITKYINKEDFNIQIRKSHNYGKSILDPFKEIIEKWLLEDKNMKRKQRHTSERIFQRLIEEHNYTGSKKTLSSYVKFRKDEIWQVTESTLPLVHNPGEMQVDFGEAQAYEKGVLTDYYTLNVTFPSSNAGYVQMYKGQNQQCLFTGLINIFERIGGIPSKIWFDNMSTAVAKVLKGGDRKLTSEFSRFVNHFNFEPVFCNPSSGNEKGSVENKVGYFRRNFLVPAPQIEDLNLFNESLLERSEKDMERKHYMKKLKISELFIEDKEKLNPLPTTAFDPGRIKVLKTDNCGRFTLESKYRYSTSPKLAKTYANVKLLATEIVILDKEYKEVIRHPRLYGEEVFESIKWAPYLTQLSKTPRAIKYSGIYEMFPSSLTTKLKDLKVEEEKEILKFMSKIYEFKGIEIAVKSVTECVEKGILSHDNLYLYFKALTDNYPKIEEKKISGLKVGMPSITSRSAEYDELYQGGSL